MFEERVEMVLDFWTEEASRVKGDYYQVPYPFKDGVKGYPAAPTASAAGVEGEVGEDGSIQKVAVLPKPYQKPHPRCFVAAMKSLETISFCAKHGFIPTYFMKDEDMAKCFNMYVEKPKNMGNTMFWVRTKTSFAGAILLKIKLNLRESYWLMIWIFILIFMDHFFPNYQQVMKLPELRALSRRVSSLGVRLMIA